MPLCGGTSDQREPSDEDRQVLTAVRSAVEEKTGKKYDLFELVGVKTQVVAGRNYFFKVKVSGEEYVHLRVFQSLQQEISLHSLQEAKKVDDSLDYF